MIILIIALPFLSGVLCLLFTKKTALCTAISTTFSALQLGLAGLLLCAVRNEGILTVQMGSWKAPVGITLVCDLFSALMILITAVIAFCVHLYSLSEVGLSLKKKHFYSLMSLLLMGVYGSFLTGDLFNLYVWFEVMLIASFVLITLEGKKDQLEGGVKYLVINLLASILFLCGIGLLYGKLGTLNMADIALKLKGTEDAFLINSSAMLLLVAFAIKSALFPFYFWLPASYHTPNTTIAALFAGLLTKVGVYALFRAYTLLFQTQFDLVQDVLIFLAATTMLFGVFGAACQYDIKKILSFHIVSQIGYIVMGLAIGTPLAITGAVFYTIHHIIVKSNLFLIAGVIERVFGTTNLRQLGGLYKYSPAFSLLFFIPAFSLGGIPPFSGFWAKFGVIKAGLEGSHYWLVATALFVGVFTLFSMTKIWAEAFWKKQPFGAKPEWDAFSKSSLAACILLSLCTLFLSFSSESLFNLAEGVSKQLLSPELYINSVLNK